MSIMKYSDINKVYTEKVNEFITNGMTINTATMAGTQGELASIDLTDGEKIYRIIIEGFQDHDEHFLEGIHMVVGIATDRVTPNKPYRDATIWNNNLEVIEEQKFYQVSDRCNDFSYYGTYEEAAAAQHKRYERWVASGRDNGYTIRRENITSDKAVAIVIPRIKKELGIKRVNRKDVLIEKIFRSSRNEKYRITYHNKTISLGC